MYLRMEGFPEVLENKICLEKYSNTGLNRALSNRQNKDLNDNW